MWCWFTSFCLISSEDDFWCNVDVYISLDHSCIEELIGYGALQALGFIFIARPEFMMVKNMDKILETTLNSTADTRIKVGLPGSLAIICLFSWLQQSCMWQVYIVTDRVSLLQL